LIAQRVGMCLCIQSQESVLKVDTRGEKFKIEINDDYTLWRNIS